MKLLKIIFSDFSNFSFFKFFIIFFSLEKMSQIRLKFMIKVEGYENVYEPKYTSDAKFIRQNRKLPNGKRETRFFLLPCEIVDEYKVFQTMPDGRKIRSHSLEFWKYSQNWEAAEKETLERMIKNKC